MKRLISLIPVLLTVLLCTGCGISAQYDSETWTCEALGLRFTLPEGAQFNSLDSVERDREASYGDRWSGGETALSVWSRTDGSALSMTATFLNKPSDFEQQTCAELFAANIAGEASWTVEEREPMTVGGQSWRAWWIEVPERRISGCYLCRFQGGYWLALGACGPSPEGPAGLLLGFSPLA